MPQSTLDDLLWARSGDKPIIAARWSTNRARIVRTKKRANELAGIWKDWKIRLGWKVNGACPDYIAISPDGTQEAFAMRVYDPKTLEVIG